MPSPFPGMDPWLEDEDLARCLHFSFCVKLSDALNVVLPVGYVATFEHHERWESSGRPPAVPDRIVSPASSEAPPHRLPTRERFFPTKELAVRVLRVSKPDHVRTAVLEVVSREARTLGRPARALFEQRQRADMMNRTNRVEIDLFRGGRPVSMVCDRLAASVCGHDGPCVVVFRSDRPAEVDVYPVRLEAPLPAVRVPVDAGVPDVLIELQPLLDDCYRAGAYHKCVDYREPPDPPLTPEQQAWADAILRERGLRPVA